MWGTKVFSSFLFILKSKLKRVGLQRLKYFLYSKYSMELAFQKEWLNEFIQNKDKVLEYWKKHRYLDDIIQICKITKDSKVLDVGCGLSSVLHFIDGKRYGVDSLADEYLKLYKYPKGIKIKKGFSECLPFPNAYFDVVFCSNVLDHVTNPKKTINEISRVLKKEGYFVLTVEIFKSKIQRDPAHPHSFLLKDVFGLLKNKFTPIFEGSSDWIGLRRYVKGVTKSVGTELIIIAKKGRTETSVIQKNSVL
jgi:ubiquinone/menaquinone biosynthesis C-methylase UbiE